MNRRTITTTKPIGASGETKVPGPTTIPAGTKMFQYNRGTGWENWGWITGNDSPYGFSAIEISPDEFEVNKE